MLYWILGSAFAAGIVILAVVSIEWTSRWIDREFRHARRLRMTGGVLGSALVLSAFLVVVTTGQPREMLLGLMFTVGVLLIGLLIVTSNLRRTGVVTVRPRRILAVGAHPDDLELSCGATLAKLTDEGHEVRTIIMCHGASGGHEDVRETEARHGASYLRATTATVLDLRDTELQRHNGTMVTEIERIIAAFRPDVVLTHSAHDHHQDHAAVHLATVRAARRCPSILCYESPSVTRQFSPGFFVDVSSYIDIKVHAIGLHRDQRGKPYMTGERARAMAVFRGDQSRMPLAEGFEVVRLAGSSLGEF